MRILFFFIRSLSGIACCALIAIALYALLNEDSTVAKKITNGHPDREATVEVMRNFWKQFFKNKIRIIAVLMMGFGLSAWQLLLVVAATLGITYFLEFKFQKIRKINPEDPKTSKILTAGTIALLVLIALM